MFFCQTFFIGHSGIIGNIDDYSADYFGEAALGVVNDAYRGVGIEGVDACGGVGGSTDAQKGGNDEEAPAYSDTEGNILLFGQEVDFGQDVDAILGVEIDAVGVEEVDATKGVENDFGQEVDAILNVEIVAVGVELVDATSGVENDFGTRSRCHIGC